jgi:hydroxyacylglutathione hydrolase
MADPVDIRWIHGSPNCAANTDPALQVHAFDDDTYILRQNKCVNFEAPFLYLLFGTQRALLLDTGAEPQPGRHLPIQATVQEIIDRWLARQSRASIELVVAHSHSHGDHTFGDAQFAGRPETIVVPPNLAAVKNFFGLSNWPTRPATIQLGDRNLTILPAPGHETAHITVYDPKTELMLTGDTFYPGFLYIRDWNAYRHTVDRLARFADEHPVRCFLGAHVEMTNTPRMSYPSGTSYQPSEHGLQLLSHHLTELQSALNALGDVPTHRVFDDFIIEPL